MDNRTVLQMLHADFIRFHQESLNVTKAAQDLKKDASNYIRALLMQIKAGSVPLLAKTPKMSKTKGTRIKTIPEDVQMENNSTISIRGSGKSFQTDILLETSEIHTGRGKRGASIKAADIIKKQQSINLSVKVKRPSKEDDQEPSSQKKIVKDYRSKRPKAIIISSDEEDTRPLKQSKIENKKAVTTSKINSKPEETDESIFSEENDDADSKKLTRKSVKRKHDEQNKEEYQALTSEKFNEQKSLSNDEPVVKKANHSKSPPPINEKDPKYFTKLERISEKSADSKKKSNERITRSFSLINSQSSKKTKVNNIVNESLEMSNNDETVVSMYEDAIGKPIPIMNSTMNPNSTGVFEKMMNVTVLIEPLSSKKILNETVTIKKSSLKEPLSTNNSTIKEIVEDDCPVKQAVAIQNARNTLRNENDLKAQVNKQLNKFNELITDDESSPERKRYIIKKEQLNSEKRFTRSTNSSTDEDEILRTPMLSAVPTKEFKISSIKSYKKAALFSPYAKDSVKKRVEAFEQVAISPKQNEHETGGRVTRTKTRALAATSFSEDPGSTVKQKLARKSLAKAKKISLAKQAREYEDTKENDYINDKYTKPKSSLEKSVQKLQSKHTPLGKNRMLPTPSSVTKLQHTPLNAQNFNIYTKNLTTSRGNIVSHVESFIQPMKSASKLYDRSAEEKRRKIHDEDARRKREELLKSQAEEKRRKREEKELKNKLAREAKERLDYEKRMKAEKDREEKAKLAQQLQEKQKEEMERKRIAQLQRAQEKEEKRKQEELLRLQRIQEQEEQERLLAEQKRREQELEKRKQAEIRHQMAELKMKNQLENKILQQNKSKALAQKQATYNYKMDSDPDEEESDDENKPKHQIPTWATKSVRQAQLAMQQHIPMRFVLKFFDAKKCTPDLRDLFQGIDPRKLKRSSSAIWKTPPRFSMMNCSILKD